MYSISFSVDPSSSSNKSETTIQLSEHSTNDAEIQLAQAIIEGNVEDVGEKFRAFQQPSNSKTLKNLNASKIHHLLPSDIQDMDLAEISLLDLAAHYKQIEVMDLFLDQSLGRD